MEMEKALKYRFTGAPIYDSRDNIPDCVREHITPVMARGWSLVAYFWAMQGLCAVLWSQLTVALGCAVRFDAGARFGNALYVVDLGSCAWMALFCVPMGRFGLEVRSRRVPTWHKSAHRHHP